MPPYSASKRSDTPESSSEDLQPAALAEYLGKIGIGPQKLHTSYPSTVTSESHQATETSGIPHGSHDAGYKTDPTSVPSQLGDDKQIHSDESEYGSSTDRLPASESRTNSDLIQDLRATPPEQVFGGIGGHLEYRPESTEFHHPVNEEEGRAIVNKVAHTTAELQEALDNGAQQINKHGLPYQLSATPQRLTNPTAENEIVGLDEHQEEPEDLQSAGPAEMRPNSVETASRMIIFCCIFRRRC